MTYKLKDRTSTWWDNFYIIINGKKNNVFILDVRWNSCYKDDFFLQVVNNFYANNIQIVAKPIVLWTNTRRNFID